MPRLGVALLLSLILVGCLWQASDPALTTGTADGSSAGFLVGVCDGFTLPIRFFPALFMESVTIFAVHNTGVPYYIGFAFAELMGVYGANKAFQD